MVFTLDGSNGKVFIVLMDLSGNAFCKQIQISE